MKKIVAFVGSARKEGYCSRVVESIKKGAEAEGAEVAVYRLNELNIRPCLGCMYCRKGNGCSIKDDDMSKIYADLADASGVVFAMPLYFGMISGQTMTLINRLYPLVPAEKTRKAVTVYAYGAPGKETYQKYIDSVNPVFKSFGFEIEDTIVCSGTGNMPAEEEKQLLAQAFDDGKALCR